MASIEFNELKKAFAGGTVAVEDFNLEIGDGEFMVLVGPSGSGKTTVLRMTAGLEAATDGEVWIGGELVNDVDPQDRNIAMVFQNYALYPHMTVYENMGFGLRLHELKKREIQERVLPAAEMLGLDDLLKRKPGQLSGGQRQRVAMGRAIVREPDAFLMDEPLSNLDAKLRVEMRAYVSLLHQRLRTTTLYVTHDQTEAMTMGDRVVVMRDGRLEQVRRATTALRQSREPVRRRLHRLSGDEPHSLQARTRRRRTMRRVVRDDDHVDAGTALATSASARVPRPLGDRRDPSRGPGGRSAAAGLERRLPRRRRRPRRADGRRADRPLPAPGRQLDGRSHR